MTTTYPAIFACARALLQGRVLLEGGVSVGQGILLDWTEEVLGRVVNVGPHPDAFDLARTFVDLVGPGAALAAAEDLPDATLAGFCLRTGRRQRGRGRGSQRKVLSP